MQLHTSKQNVSHQLKNQDITWHLDTTALSNHMTISKNWDTTLYYIEAATPALASGVSNHDTTTTHHCHQQAAHKS
jgi:hypothetical protein